MIYARKGLYGLLWCPRAETGNELVRGWEYARARFGTDALTGKVYGQPPTIQGVEGSPGLPAGMWLFELRASS